MLYEGLISANECLLCLASSAILHALIDNPDKLALVEMPVLIRETGHSVSLMEYVGSFALNVSCCSKTFFENNDL